MSGTSQREYPSDLRDLIEYPGMVRWFSPLVLAKTARKAIDSALFGQYADRRLIHAALDPIDDTAIKSRCDFSTIFPRTSDGTTWIDYVADLGDGFDSTYAIAYLLGRSSLSVDGLSESLPRGHALIMGGDQVYPDATRDDYKKRLIRPYEFAFPDSDAEDADHPPLFMIPGNHDWYDGLVLFLAMFCRGRGKKVGSWIAGEMQHRSYFAIALPDDWWIWGFDSQLGEDIDEPQADYFTAIARTCMRPNSKLVICAAVPTWLRAELYRKRSKTEREKLYRGLSYIANNIATKNCKGVRICAVLSGDMHHYSRYSGQRVNKNGEPDEDPAYACQFITAGGGGAFLHPTHQLEDSFKMGWLGRTLNMSLETNPGQGHEATQGIKACYPDQRRSKLLLLRNFGFPIVNFSFAVALGVFYWITALIVAATFGNELSRAPDKLAWVTETFEGLQYYPSFWLLLAGLTIPLWAYADARTPEGRWAIAFPPSAAHLFLIVLLVSGLPVFNSWLVARTGVTLGLPEWLLPSPKVATALLALPPPISLWTQCYIWFGKGLSGWFLPGTLSEFVLFAIEMVLAGGLLGGFVWGAYLMLTCGFGKIHDNDGFSAMRLGLYRHFLRLRITKDELTIFPIGIDSPPRRTDWLWNPARKRNEQHEPEVVPKSPLKYHLIENPIVIRVPSAQTPEAQKVEASLTP